MRHPGSLFDYFRPLKRTLQFLQQMYVKNVNLVYNPQPSELESPPITTIPWLPPNSKLGYCDKFCNLVEVISCLFDKHGGNSSFGCNIQTKSCVWKQSNYSTQNFAKWDWLKLIIVDASVTRLGDLMDFGQPFKAVGNN